MGNGMVDAGSLGAYAAYEKRIQGLIAEEAFELPMLPQVASQVISMSNNPQASLQDLADLIHKDHVLAGHVLRIANSAAFCAGNPVVSLSQALARLGMAIIGEIAMSASLKQGIFHAPGFDDVIHSLWAHALASGAIGKEIARSKRYNVEGQYLCSLLHAIGKPIALQLVIQVKHDTEIDISNQEILLLIEKYHVPLGSKIALKWKLPQTVLFAIKYYQKYAEASQFKHEAMMTHLADHMASWLLQTKTVSDDELKQHPIFIALNYYPDEVEALLQQREAFLQMVNAMSL